DVGIVVDGRAGGRGAVPRARLADAAGTIGVGRAGGPGSVAADVDQADPETVTVARVADAVSVRVLLVRVPREHAVVARVHLAVRIEIARGAAAGEATAQVAGGVAATRAVGGREAGPGRSSRAVDAAARLNRIAGSGVDRVVEIRTVVGRVGHAVTVQVVVVAGVADVVVAADIRLVGI